MPRALLLLALAACDAEPADSGDAKDGDDTGLADCHPEDDAGQSIVDARVGVTNTRGWYVSDATVSWESATGTADVCHRVDWGEWRCQTEPTGELTVTVEHPLYATATATIAPDADGCRSGDERVDVVLSPVGTPFPESRMYYVQLIDDPYACEHSWELYGVGCYQTAAFCADGYSVVILTDIVNQGVYDVQGDTLTNTTVSVADMPEETTWTVVSDEELAWEGQTWRLDTEGKFEMVDCESA